MDKKELLKKVELRLQNYKFLEMQINNIELDIKKEKMEYRGCGAINYYERTGTTNNISRTVENEVIAKEKKIEKLMQYKSDKEIEKQKIENALSCLDEFEISFFELLYCSKFKTTIPSVALKLHIDRSHGYRVREIILHKIMNMLYTEEIYSELHLINS
ncbi:MAG: hypothetical protein ACLUG9_16905 [Paraclostridium sordellii]